MHFSDQRPQQLSVEIGMTQKIHCLQEQLVIMKTCAAQSSFVADTNNNFHLNPASVKLELL